MSIVHEPAPTDIRDFRSTNVFQLRVILILEENGYSALARDLPGVASQGDTIEEAIENIREACIGAIEVYKEKRLPIPWGSWPCRCSSRSVAKMDSCGCLRSQLSPAMKPLRPS